MGPRPHRGPFPLTVVWRWRWEIGLLGLVGVLLWAAGRPPGRLVVLVLILLGALAMAAPLIRRSLLRRAWAIVVQHRIRVGCAEAALHGRTGRLPAVLLARLTQGGERLYLWNPAGVTIGDFVIERERLAAACWARALRVHRHPRWAHIVIVDVVRYEQQTRQGQDGQSGAATRQAQPPPGRPDPDPPTRALGWGRSIRPQREAGQRQAADHEQEV